MRTGKLSDLTDRASYTRQELLFIINEIESAVSIESFSNVLDVKEELGFNRNEDAK